MFSKTAIHKTKQKFRKASSKAIKFLAIICSFIFLLDIMEYVTPISKEICSQIPLLEPDLGMRLVTSKHFCSRSLAHIKKF